MYSKKYPIESIELNRTIGFISDGLTDEEKEAYREAKKREIADYVIDGIREYLYELCESLDPIYGYNREMGVNTEEFSIDINLRSYDRSTHKYYRAGRIGESTRECKDFRLDYEKTPGPIGNFALHEYWEGKKDYDKKVKETLEDVDKMRSKKNDS